MTQVPDGWSEFRLGDLAAGTKAALATGPFGSAVSAKNFRSSGVPLLRGSNLSEDVGTRLDDNELVFLDPDLADTFQRSTVMRGDLVFTSWGTIGQVGFVDASSRYERYVVSNKQMKMTVDRSRVDPQFLYYYLSTPSMIELVKSQAIGSSVPGFNLGQLKSLSIAIPQLSEQRSISEVLGALDDKIAANRKLADTADSLVRALFEETSARSQETGTVAQLVTNVRETVTPARVAANFSYVGLEHIARRHMWLAEAGDPADVQSAKSKFQSGDVLFGKLRPYFHKVATATTEGICSTDILVLRPTSDAIRGWALATLTSDEVVAAVVASSEGTRMPRASWKDLSAVRVPWPGESEARAISAKVENLRSIALSAVAECRVLATTRDALLPRLMSGELRVRDAERSVAQVL